MKELKEAFDKKGYLLSAAVSPSKTIIDYAYDVQSLAQNLDWISVMTYDYHGYWDGKTGHVSPMYKHPEDDFDYFNVVSSNHLIVCTGGTSIFHKRKIQQTILVYHQQILLFQ